MLFHSASGLQGLLRDCLKVHGDSVKIIDGHRLREERLDALLYNALFQPNEKVRYFLCWLIRQAASECAIYLSSLAGLYAKAGRGQIPKFMIPAASLRHMPYAAGRAAFRAAREASNGAVVFSLSPAEPALTSVDYATCLLAAALREGYEGPVFLEADYLRAEAAEDLSRLQDRIEEALAAGFFNLLFDLSRLVDLTLPEPNAQAAYTLCAELASCVHQGEPKGVGSALGVRFACRSDADLVPFLRTFMEGFEAEFVSRVGHVPGLSKFDLRIRGVADLPAAIDFAEVARREYSLPTGISSEDASALEEVMAEEERLPFAELHLGDWLAGRLSSYTQLWDLPQEEQEAFIAELAGEWVVLFRRLKAVDNLHLVLNSVAIQQTELPRPAEGYHQDVETYYHDILDQLGQ